MPGPACYARGGSEPTVTDANLVLGRIIPEQFVGGAMRVHADLARNAIEPIARSIGRSIEQSALGILRVAEQNMSRAIRAVTSRRGLDPRDFALVSFGGAGGLHACALAESLDIRRVLVPPYCGVLSALGMVAAPAAADVSKTVLHLGEGLDDARLAAEFGFLNMQASEYVSHEKPRLSRLMRTSDFTANRMSSRSASSGHSETLSRQHSAKEYRKLYGQAPEGRPVEIVTLRIRRLGHFPRFELPEISPGDGLTGAPVRVHLLDAAGRDCDVSVFDRGGLVGTSDAGPFLIIDPEATTYVAPGWTRGIPNGAIVLETDSKRCEPTQDTQLG